MVYYQIIYLVIKHIYMNQPIHNKCNKLVINFIKDTKYETFSKKHLFVFQSLQHSLTTINIITTINDQSQIHGQCNN